MDLKQLEYFLAVAEERHFTRAARRLNIVQSGLSAAIRGLEEDLGGPLFVRSTRRVELTQAGRVLAEEARRVLAAARDARRAVTEVHGLARGRLRIGSIQGLAPFVDLPGSLGRFHDAFAGIEIELSFDGSAALLDRVRDGGLDIAFTQPAEPPPDTVAQRMLACEGMVVVTAPRHRLAGRAGIGLADLAGETFVDLKADWGMRQLVDRACAVAGLRRHSGFEVNDLETLIDLVAGGLGVALVPESVALARRADPRAAPVAVAELREDQEPCWELAVAFQGRPDAPESPVARAFLDLLVLPGEAAAAA